MSAIELTKRKLMFSLLRSAISDSLLSDEEKSFYNMDALTQIAKTAKQHDVLHLLVLGLKKNDLIDESNKYLETEILRAVYRYEQINYEFNRLCEALEKASIPYIPLKGSVIRKYYPEPWMRTSCDIDVLVHAEDLDKAVSCLSEKLDYEYECTTSHDASLFAKGGVHIELHYDLVEDGLANAAAKVLRDVWDTASRRNAQGCRFKMSDEMFYFYHIAHMAKHFENGGCGIRPFIDLFVLDTTTKCDMAKQNALLEKGNLLRFANVARKLSCVWFTNEEHEALLKQMEAYILNGGVYGSDANRITVQQQKKGGKFKYALFKIFLPYDAIKFHYPILQKHKWLTPFMEIRRWCKLIFCGHLKRTTKELRYNNNISNTDASNMQVFLTNIGL